MSSTREWVRQTEDLQRTIHGIACDHGFWEGEKNDGEIIALIHSELSEALEALRDGNPPSVKAEGYSCLEEELADVIIRVLDYAGGRNLRVAQAVIAKMKHNLGRPHKHGREL